VADWPLTSDLGPLGALPTVPRLARGFVSVTLNSWGLDALTDVIELLVSELSTNVVRASMNPDGTVRYDDDGKLPLLWIRLLFDHERLMLEVWDTLPASLGAPVARHPDPDEESGRGLEIIEMLAEDWGWETVPGWAGKKVWAILKVVQLPPGATMTKVRVKATDQGQRARSKVGAAACARLAGWM
jgi:anti-sigma regulatory factor (Ser/Thr protein kinase)